MLTVLRIFFNDVKSVAKHFFALAVIIAISVLPALYAWMNIYANGNPYGNTGNIRIAVASNDPGIRLGDGRYVNMADEVSEELKESTSISWQFPGSEAEAVEGVRSGDYYAAVVFGEDFTENMYDFEKALSRENPPVTYYTNTKKNAVASKITDTAAETLLKNINTKYLETVIEVVFGKASDTVNKIADNDVVEEAVARLRDVQADLDEYNRVIDSFASNTGSVKRALRNSAKKVSRAQTQGDAAVTSARRNLSNAERALDDMSDSVDERLAELSQKIDKVETVITELQDEGLLPDSDEFAVLDEEADTAIDELVSYLEVMKKMLSGQSNLASVQSVITTLDNMIAEVELIRDTYRDDAAKGLELIALVRNMKGKDLTQGYKAVIRDLKQMIKSLSPVIMAIDGLVSDVTPVIDAGTNTIEGLDESLVQLQQTCKVSSAAIDELVKKVEKADDNEKISLILSFLNGDPERYGRFLSSLVDVEVRTVYHVASYGAAMAPFYSVLAIWVGGVILVSILKTGVDRKKFPKANEAECFFGRFIIFFLIGQVQAAVIMAGDIYLLGCEPEEPRLMFLAGAVTSFVFVMFIYALTLSFGDIGKAIVVVVMVVQIAGSSGSYPIEILPEIFGKIYKFFPFPYAINAVREALCGMYVYDYWRYLAELLVFGVLGLVIGLLVRRPFIRMNSFVTEKIEETEVL